MSAALGATPVSHIMSERIVAVTEGTGLMAAMDALLVTGLRHLVVVDRAGRFTGILGAELLATALRGSVGPRATVASLTAARHWVDPGTTAQEASRQMLDASVDALGVVDYRAEVVGIVTWSDIVRLVATDDPSALP